MKTSLHTVSLVLLILFSVSPIFTAAAGVLAYDANICTSGVSLCAPAYTPPANPLCVSIILKGTVSSSDSGSVNIPLKRAGRLFLIEAIIDGQDGNLIFDTGASGLVINRTYFRKYASVSTSSGSGGISGNNGKTLATVIRSMNISGMAFTHVQADIADLGHIEDRRGVKILGLFGFSLLKDMQVIFDGPGNQLLLSKTDDKGDLLYPETDPVKFDCTGKLITRQNLMMIEATINDKPLRFCLDTGAEINVLHYALPRKILNTVEINRRSDLGGSGSGVVKALYGTMSELTFACNQFGKMDAVIIDLTSMCEAYGCAIDGMLGFDFWQKGIFMFNFRKQVISYSLRKGDVK